MTNRMFGRATGRGSMNGRCWIAVLLLAACALMVGCSSAPTKPPPRTPSEWIALPRPQ